MIGKVAFLQIVSPVGVKKTPPGETIMQAYPESRLGLETIQSARFLGMWKKLIYAGPPKIAKFQRGMVVDL